MKKSFNSNHNDGALSGILVLDHTSALAGPYCTQLLGDLGADVIKIERPGTGDQSRSWGPPFVGEVSAYFLGTNRNKRGITLDLSQKKGREIFHKLIEKADVLVHNVPREKSRQKLGMDENACQTLNPRLIWASISGFGNTGPLAEQPGYDVIAQGMSGTMHITGEEGSPPIRFPTPIADITTGMYAALAIVTALFSRERSGKGQCIDLALLDSQVTWLANLASKYLADNEPLKKMGNAHPSIVPYQPFPTTDQWIIIGVATEGQWKKFTEVIDWPALYNDSRFASNPDRLLNREILVPLIAERLRKKPSKFWLEKLKVAGIPNGPILTPENALSHDQLLARGMIVELEHPVLGAIRSIGNPMKFSETPISYRRPAPLLGEHTSEVLSELGYGKADIEEMKTDGII